MKPERFKIGEQQRQVAINSNEAQIAAMWLCAEEKLGRELDRNDDLDKQAMFGVWFTKNLPGNRSLATFWGDYVQAHPKEIDIDDKNEVLEAVHLVEETIQ